MDPNPPVEVPFQNNENDKNQENMRKKGQNPKFQSNRNFGIDISNKIRSSTTSTSRNPPSRIKLKLKEDPLKNLSLYDKENLNNPQQVSLYAGSIISHLLTLEIDPSYSIQADYMKDQPDLNPKIRRTLIEWVIEAHFKYRMVPEVLYLAVSVIDRFLSVNKVYRSQLQLIAITSLLIASKFEEIYPPSVQRFIYMSEIAIDINDILEMEGKILSDLDFKLIGPSSYSFFDRYALIFGVKLVGKAIGRFLLDLALVDYKTLKFKPSIIACSSIVLALKVIGESLDEKRMKECLGYGVIDLEECSKILCFLMIKCIKDKKFQSLSLKYGSKGLFDVMSFFIE